MIREFNKYIGKFNFKDKMIRMKYFHSFKVMRISNLIARSLKLNNKEIKLARTIGLLHDLGRFEQASKYHTFNDKESIDHGDYGAVVISSNNFNLKKENYDIIKLAIINHNKKDLQNNLTAKEKLFCQIIRDADKLAILTYLSKKQKPQKLNNQISYNVKKAFFNQQLINYKECNTNLDYIICVLSFVYNINYNYSFNYLNQKKIFPKLEKRLNRKELKEYFKEANRYINERVEKDVKTKI